MASKYDLADQVNIHSQISNFCKYMGHILLSKSKSHDETSQQHAIVPCHDSLSLAIGSYAPPLNTKLGKKKIQVLKFNY